LLVTLEGAVRSLEPVTEIAAAYRLDEGWAVVGGGAGAADLWWVAPDAEPVAVLSGMDTIVLGPGRVAWRERSTLSVAVLTGTGEVTEQADTGVPDGGVEPVGFLGTRCCWPATAARPGTCGSRRAATTARTG